MIIVKQINSILGIQRIQELAAKSNYDVFIHSPDNAIMVDAKSFIGLWALDFSKPVKIVSEDEIVLRAIENTVWMA